MRQRTRSTMLDMIVLVIFLRLVELSGLLDGGHDLAAEESLGLGNLLDEPSRFLRLQLIFDEDGRPILRTHVGALAVELGGIVEFEEPLHQILVADFLGVEGHADGFRVPGLTGTDVAVRGVGRAAAHVPGHGMNHAGYLLKAILDAPEAAAGKVRGMRLARF